MVHHEGRQGRNLEAEREAEGMVCVHVCVCTHACGVYVCVYMHVCTYVCLCVVCVHMHVYVHVNVCECACGVYVCVHVHTCLSSGYMFLGQRKINIFGVFFIFLCVIFLNQVFSLNLELGRLA